MCSKQGLARGAHSKSCQRLAERYLELQPQEKALRSSKLLPSARSVRLLVRRQLLRALHQSVVDAEEKVAEGLAAAQNETARANGQAGGVV